MKSLSLKINESFNNNKISDSKLNDKELKSWIYGDNDEDMHLSKIDMSAELSYRATVNLGDKTYWDDTMIQKHKGKIDYVATMNDFLVGCDIKELKLIYNAAKILLKTS